MGDPGLLEELPDIPPLLPEGSGDLQQAAPEDRTLAGLDAVTDLALNHRLAQGTFCGVVGGLDASGLQESPQPTFHLLALLAGGYRAGPRRSLLVVVPVAKQLLLQAQQLRS